jgi:hypothetical protein
MFDSNLVSKKNAPKEGVGFIFVCPLRNIQQEFETTSS